MAKRTAKIFIGGDEYVFHPFTLGELEEVAGIIEAKESGISQFSRSFAILKIAMRRAEPRIEDPSAIEPESLDEVIEAAKAILLLSGLTAKENPPPDPPPADQQDQPAPPLH